MKEKTEKLLDSKNWVNPKTGQRYRYFSRQGDGYDDVLGWAKEFQPPINPLDREKWFEEVKVVKQEYVFFKRFWISTVWLGLDHSWDEKTPPLIFESMVFRYGGHSDQDMNRYTTESEALEGHKELVRKWSNPLYIFWHFFYHEGLEDWYYDIKWKLKRRFHERKEGLI